MNALDPALIWGIVIFGGLIAIAVFFICRIIACWYFRINEIVKLLTEIRDKLLSQGSAEPEPKETKSSTDVK